MKNVFFAVSIILLSGMLSSCKTFYVTPIKCMPVASETWRPKEFKQWNDSTDDVYIIAINDGSVSFKFINKKFHNTMILENVTDFKRTYDRYKAAGMQCILQRRRTRQELASK